YGTDSARCKVASWSRSGTTLQAFVRCSSTTSGTAKNSKFTVSYLRRGDQPGAEGGYVRADQSTNPWYVPSRAYQWSSLGQYASVQRTAVGAYIVSFAGQKFGGGTVEVTAYGTGSQYCKVSSWGPQGNDQNVGVLCFDATGAPADSKFTAVFS